MLRDDVPDAAEKESKMADKDAHELALAAAVRAAELEARKANAQPAGPGRIERIAKADAALLDAGQALDHHLSGQGGAPMKTRR